MTGRASYLTPLTVPISPLNPINKFNILIVEGCRTSERFFLHISGFVSFSFIFFHGRFSGPSQNRSARGSPWSYEALCRMNSSPPRHQALFFFLHGIGIWRRKTCMGKMRCFSIFVCVCFDLDRPIALFVISDSKEKNSESLHLLALDDQ